MSHRNVMAAALIAALAGGACVDYEAGAGVLSGKSAVFVGMDLVSRAMPGSPQGSSVTQTQPGTATHAINLPIANLPPLVDGSSYQVWLVNESGLAVQRIGASHQLQRPDTVGRDPVTEELIIVWRLVGTPQNVQSFASPQGLRHVLQVRASDATAAGTSLSNFTHIVITIGESGDASPLTAPAPAWFRYRNPAVTTAAQWLTGPVRFGFQPVAALVNTPWSAFGGGSVEFLNVVGFGLMVRRIARPPLGFFYDVWLVGEENPSIRLGPLATPAPYFEPLVEADVALRTDYVSQTEVIKGARWGDWAELGITVCTPAPGVTGPNNSSDRYSSVAIVLRSKKHVSDDVQPPTILWESRIPSRLDRMPVEKERNMHDRR